MSNHEFAQALTALARTPGNNEDTPIKAFVTNLGKYNEGALIGEWVSFPTTQEHMQDVFKRIGIDGVRYEEYFVTDYDIDIRGVYDALGEYENLSELNYLASRIEELDEAEREVFEAAVAHGGHGNGMQGLINLTYNIYCYDLLRDAEDESDLGYYWIEESGCYDTETLGNLAQYIDYERFGRDIALEEGGTFTDHGYITENGNDFEEVFDGIHVPEEYKVFPMKKAEPPQREAPPKSKTDMAR